MDIDNFKKEKIVLKQVHNNYFEIRLKGNTFLTPSGAVLRIPSKDLTEAIIRELRMQKQGANQHLSPLLKLACLATEEIVPNKKSVIDFLLSYAETDLLCYWSDSGSDFEKMQSFTWGPLLQWIDKKLGIRMRVSRSLTPIKQSENAIKAIRLCIENLEANELACLFEATRLAGSVIIGLALILNHITVKEAVQAAQLDELYQEKKWGLDEELTARRHNIEKDLLIVEKYLNLLDRTNNFNN